MQAPLAWFVALRYTRAKRRNRLLSFITFISITAIALGVMVLVIVMSVMNGFEKELRRGILSVSSHVTFQAFNHEEVDLEAVKGQLLARPDVNAVTTMIVGPGMIGQGQGTAIQLRGVQPGEQKRISNISSKMIAGSMDALEPGGVVIGKVMAEKLGVKPGDKISVLFSQSSFAKRNILPKLYRFNVAGIFWVGIYEYDNRVTFIHHQDAERLLLGAAGVVRLQINTTDPFSAPALAQELKQQYELDFFVMDWTRRFFNLFRAVQQQKGMMFIILSMIVLVAALSIITALIMVVIEKSSEIAILRTIGAKPRLIMQVFVIQGFVIGLAGTLVGLAGGILIADNIDVIISTLEHMLGMKLLPGEVYRVSRLSGDKHWADILQIALTAFTISLLATVYPAWKAAHTKPAAALKFE